jgi:hypothetical protein
LFKFRHYLRLIALALIVFPEPITTAIGLCLLTGTLLLPGGRKRLSKFRNMEELLARSLKNEEKEKLGCVLKKTTAVLHGLKLSEPSLQTLNQAYRPLKIKQKPATCGRTIAALATATPHLAFPGYQSGNWFDNRRVPAKIWPRTLQDSITQYKALPAVSPSGSISAGNRESGPGVELHTLKTNLLPQIEQSRKAPAADAWRKRFFTPDEVVFHALKTKCANT